MAGDQRAAADRAVHALRKLETENAPGGALDGEVGVNVGGIASAGFSVGGVAAPGCAGVGGGWVMGGAQNKKTPGSFPPGVFYLL